MTKGQIALDPRLAMIARLAGRCDTLADIGCDHGRLGAYMLQRGLCRHAILTDISPDSLNKARRLIGHVGLEEHAHFCVGSGLEALDSPADTVVIAGMGGATISEILRNGIDRLCGARLVLEPNVGTEQVRRALKDLDYCIEDERVVHDGRRLYVIIMAMPGKADYSPKELVVGPVFLRRLPDELTPYAEFRLRVAQKALKGAQRANDEVQIRQLAQETDIWEEVLKCLQA